MTKLLKNQKELFSYIDSDFVNLNVNEGVEDTGITLKQVKQEKNFTFKDVFNPDTDYVSQSDVIDWVEKNKEEILKTRHCYLFLLKNSESAYFVADAYECIGKVLLYVRKFADARVWKPGFVYVIILPQRTLESSEKSLSPSETLSLEKMIGKIVMAGYTVTKTK